MPFQKLFDIQNTFEYNLIIEYFDTRNIFRRQVNLFGNNECAGDYGINS